MDNFDWHKTWKHLCGFGYWAIG